MIHVTVRERDAAAQATEPITTGSVGLPVRFCFAEDWEGLAVCAVFRGSGESVDMALEDGACAVPHEVLQSAGGHLKIGVYGTGDDGQRVTPTVWADAGPIREGAEPAEVEPTPATETLIQKLLEAAAELKDLDDTLTVSGAPADAKAVGDKAFLVRGPVTAWSGSGEEPDFRTTLEKPGMYYKDGNITLEGGVNSSAARILLFRSASGGYGKTMIWVDLNTGSTHFCSYKGGTGSTWTTWKKVETEDALNTLIYNGRSGANLNLRAELNYYAGNLESFSVLDMPVDSFTFSSASKFKSSVPVEDVQDLMGTGRYWVYRSGSQQRTDSYNRFDIISEDGKEHYVLCSNSVGTNWQYHDATVDWAKTMAQRKSLTAQDDMDDLTEPGYYFKDAGVSVENGADSTGGARILVIRSPASGYSVAQLWFDTSSTRLLFRTQARTQTEEHPEGGFSAWKELMPRELCYQVSGKTEVGLLSYGSGKGYLGNNTDLAYTRSEMMYEVEPGAYLEIEFPDYSSTLTGVGEITVLFYKEDGTFGGDHKTVTQTNPFQATVPVGCRYAKLATYYGSAAAERSERFTIKSDRPITERHNLNLVNTSSAGVTTIGNDQVPVEFRGDTFQTLAFTYNVSAGVRTSGRLLLPRNYTVDGAKVPLLVFVHGTNGMMNRSAQLGKIGSGSYIPYLQYLADEGFAVFDCYPWTYQKTFSTDTSSPMLLRSNINAYLSGIRYVCSRFNVDIDQVSLLCKSQGGYIGWWAMSQDEFPFRAVALFAPWGNHSGTLFFGSDANNKRIRHAVLDEMELSGTDAEKEAFVNSGTSLDGGTVQGFCEAEGNWQKLLGMASILYGVETVEKGLASTATDAEKAAAKELFTKVRTGSSAVPQWMIDEGLETPPEGVGWHITAGSSCKDLVKRSRCPSKFWTALDDDAVSGYDTYAGYTWLRNGGGDTEFRQLADNTGGHHAMDTDANAEKVNVAFTTELGVSYAANIIPLAYYEVAEWLKRKARPDLEPYATKDWVQRQGYSTGGGGGGGGASPYTSNPAALGTASPGSSDKYSRGDHVHPKPSASDVGAIPAPASPSVGDGIYFDGSTWGKAARVPEVTVSTAGDVTLALDPGKIYHFTGAISSLTLTLTAPAGSQLAQYHFDFNSGSTPATISITGVTWPDGSFAPEASSHYEVDILNGYALVAAWEVSS